MPETTRREYQVKDIPVENPRGIESAYSNHAVVGITQWDVRLAFMEIAGLIEAKPKIVLKADIVMSQDHFRALVRVLNENLAALDKTTKSQ